MRFNSCASCPVSCLYMYTSHISHAAYGCSPSLRPLSLASVHHMVVACCPPARSSEATEHGGHGDSSGAEQHTWCLCSPSSPSWELNTNKSRMGCLLCPFIHTEIWHSCRPPWSTRDVVQVLRFSAELWVGGRRGGICSVICSTTGAAHV